MEKTIIVKHLNGLMFESTQVEFDKNYGQYGSTIATEQEWRDYCHPNVVATVEAIEDPEALETDLPPQDPKTETPKAKTEVKAPVIDPNSKTK